jgi:hypothetical protein
MTCQKNGMFRIVVHACTHNQQCSAPKLVNINATGDRVASMIFGSERAFILVGKNKIMKNIDEALYRIKNLIAPFHAESRQFITLCAQTGKCGNCG